MARLLIKTAVWKTGFWNCAWASAASDATPAANSALTIPRSRPCIARSRCRTTASISAIATPPTARSSTASPSWKRGLDAGQQVHLATWNCLSKAPAPTWPSRNSSASGQGRRHPANRHGRVLAPPAIGGDLQMHERLDVMCDGCVRVMRVRGGQPLFLCPKCSHKCERIHVEQPKRKRGSPDLWTRSKLKFGFPREKIKK